MYWLVRSEETLFNMKKLLRGSDDGIRRLRTLYNGSVFYQPYAGAMPVSIIKRWQLNVYYRRFRSLGSQPGRHRRACAVATTNASRVSAHGIVVNLKRRFTIQRAHSAWRQHTRVCGRLTFALKRGGTALLAAGMRLFPAIPACVKRKRLVNMLPLVENCGQHTFVVPLQDRFFNMRGMDAAMGSLTFLPPPSRVLYVCLRFLISPSAWP